MDRTSINNCMEVVQECLLKLRPFALLICSVAFAIFILKHMSSTLPWIIMKCIIIDSALMLSFPLFILLFWRAISNMLDYSIYENIKSMRDIRSLPKDTKLHIWEEKKYYDYVKFVDVLYISVGYNVIEAPSVAEEGNVIEDPAQAPDEEGNVIEDPVQAPEEEGNVIEDPVQAPDEEGNVIEDPLQAPAEEANV